MAHNQLTRFTRASFDAARSTSEFNAWPSEVVARPFTPCRALGFDNRPTPAPTAGVRGRFRGNSGWHNGCPLTATALSTPHPPLWADDTNCGSSRVSADARAGVNAPWTV